MQRPTLFFDLDFLFLEQVNGYQRADQQQIGVEQVTHNVECGQCHAHFRTSGDRNQHLCAVGDNTLEDAGEGVQNAGCALVADEKFKKKYIKETEDWYMDFSKEIPEAVEVLKKSL